jgi:hypothetical protein
MDLSKMIRAFYEEKGKLVSAIASLEELQRTAGDIGNLRPAGNRRGRKSMPAGERAEVSVRMKRYWAAQRELRQKRTREV